MLSPEHFPSLTCVSLILLSLTTSPSSKPSVKSYNKADLDTVKRRLQFGTPRSAQSAAPDDLMKSIGLEMTSLNIQDNPFSGNEKSPFNDGITEREQFHASTPDVTKSVKSTPGVYTFFCPISQ